MLGQNSVAHTLNDRGTGRRLVDLMEKMDRGAMVTAAEALVPLTDPDLLEQLKNYPDSGDVVVRGDHRPRRRQDRDARRRDRHRRQGAQHL